MLPENVVVIILTVPSICVNTNFLFFWWEFKLEMLLVTSTQQLPWQPQGMADVMTTEIGKPSARAWRRQQQELVSGVSSCQAVQHWGVKKQRKKKIIIISATALLKSLFWKVKPNAVILNGVFILGECTDFSVVWADIKTCVSFLFACLFWAIQTSLKAKQIWGDVGDSEEKSEGQEANQNGHGVMLWTKIVPVRDASGSEKQQMYKVNWKLSGNVRSSLCWDIFCHHPANLVTGVERRMLLFEAAITTRH